MHVKTQIKKSSKVASLMYANVDREEKESMMADKYSPV